MALFLLQDCISSGLNWEKMEPPYEEQYSQEGNPRAYMTMRDYRNLDQEEENLEEECLTETILVEQAQLQPQEELKVELVEAPPEELQDAPESGDTFWPWKKEEQTSALISEEGSGKEIVEDPQKHVLQPIPTNPTANAKTTYNLLPVAPSDNQVYILPSPAPKSTHAAPAPNHKSNPLSAMQKFKKLVAIAQIFAITSKAQAAAYTAWHSGWFGCRFRFGAPEPRHF